MLMKTSGNELQNVLVMKLNLQSLKICKTTVHPAIPIATVAEPYKLHHLTNTLFLEISLNL